MVAPERKLLRREVEIEEFFLGGYEEGLKGGRMHLTSCPESTTYMRSLRCLLPGEDDVEARRLLALSLFNGSHFLAADHGTRSRRVVVGWA